MREADESEDGDVRARPGRFPRSPSPSRCFPVFTHIDGKRIPPAPKKKTRTRRHHANGDSYTNDDSYGDDFSHTNGYSYANDYSYANGYSYATKKTKTSHGRPRSRCSSPNHQFPVFTFSTDRQVPSAPIKKKKTRRTTPQTTPSTPTADRRRTGAWRDQARL